MQSTRITHGLSSFRTATTCEDTETAEPGLLLVTEQPKTPIERIPQRSLSLRKILRSFAFQIARIHQVVQQGAEGLRVNGH
jgi:hypothetical protein